MTQEDITALRREVNQLRDLVMSINHNIVRILSTIGNQPVSSDAGSSGGGGGSTTTVDLGPIEERLDELQSNMVSRELFDELVNRVEEINSEKMREAQLTIDRVTSLLEQGCCCAGAGCRAVA